MRTTLLRPEPVDRRDTQPVDRTDSAGRAAARLRDGEWLMVKDMYSTGAEILSQLGSQLPPPPEDAA